MWKYLACLVLASTLAFAPSSTRASGLKTHLWIAEEIIRDLAPDCAVTLDGRQYDIPRPTCEAILLHRNHFKAGALGPDAYPDLIAGQVTVHPGVEGDWQTRDWLVMLTERAVSPEEVAFAAGYLVHAASDTFAHTYVNGYAGDIFELGDERAVELRHFVLEKYIDAALPDGSPDPHDLAAPNEFLANNLILNPEAARVYEKSGTAGHIAAMYVVYERVEELADSLDHLEAEAGNALGYLAKLHVDLTLQVIDGEAQLFIAENALIEVDQSLTLQRELFNRAKDTLDDAIDAAKRNRGDILATTARANTARQAIRRSSDALTSANDSIGYLEVQLIDLKRRISNLPAEQCRTWSDNVCHSACNWLGNLCSDICDVVTRVSCWVPDTYAQVANQIAGVEGEIAKAHRAIRQAPIDIATFAAQEAVSLQEKAELELLTAGLEAARAAAEVSFGIVDLQYQTQLAVVAETGATVRRIREEIASLREQLVDTDQLKNSVSGLVEDSDVLSFYAKNWRDGIEVAAAEYIKTGTEVAIGLASGDSGAFSAYAEWLSCYGGAFTPVPYQAGQWACEAKSAYEEFSKAIDQIILDVLPGPLSDLYQEFLNLKGRLKNEMRSAVGDAFLELVKLAAPDASTREFIDLLANPQNSTATRVNTIFAEVGDAGGKALLTFPKATDLINADLHLRNSVLDPERFGALRNARTLSRLALLDADGVNLLTWRLGGAPGAVRTSRRYSVLFEMLRSIDGNHQWQPFALPYARSEGDPEPMEPSERHFGFGPGDTGETGFHLFIDPVNRRRVFSRLFPLSAAGAVAQRPELQGSYPFPECPGHLFPVAFDGEVAAASDRTCDGLSARRVSFTRFGEVAVRFWRQILYAFGRRPQVAEIRVAAESEKVILQLSHRPKPPRRTKQEPQRSADRTVAEMLAKLAGPV